MDFASRLKRQQLIPVRSLSSESLPAEHGVYCWYKRGRALYVGEASGRSLRELIWTNQIRGRAADSPLRNKMAQALRCRPAGNRRYTSNCEARINELLAGCHLRVLSLQSNLTKIAQGAIIGALDPPMNDQPGASPGWRISESRAILGIKG